MSKKLFAILLLIPMLVFVGDQVLGNTSPEGGKDKKKKKQNTEAQAANNLEQPQMSHQEAAVAPVNSGMSRGFSHTEAEKLAILKNYFVDLDQQFMDYEDNELRSYDEEVGEDISKLLDKKLLSPLRKIDPSDVDSKEWFSRCPSGYFYTIDGDENNKPLATGTMGQHRGCSRVSLGKFRYDVVAGTVELKLPEDLGYVNLKDYLKLRAAALA